MEINTQKGTTLIEVVIYIALLGFILFGLIGTAFNLLRNVTTNQEGLQQAEELNFALRKINWAFSDMTAINAPTAGATSTSVSVNKNGFSPNPLKLDSASGTLRMSYGNGNFTPFTSEAVVFENVWFKHQAASGTQPAAVVSHIEVGDAVNEFITYVQ